MNRKYFDIRNVSLKLIIKLYFSLSRVNMENISIFKIFIFNKISIANSLQIVIFVLLIFVLLN
ncbi:hypothetical protein D1AOALGA4SA_11572 [Olavius algarvensis Delta 1 endosymbiont]|nr:hypothetical protein D1AOALGA4SA_11572 [Olavius algarvensis Delta 1 endosymbiont]